MTQKDQIQLNRILFDPMLAQEIFTLHGVNSHALEDYWLVISGDLGNSRRAEKELSRLDSSPDSTVIERTSQQRIGP